MNILALDTSSEWCSAALLRAGGVSWREERAGQRHSELILPMIDGLLEDAGMRLQDLDAVGFGAGPGSFTGLRIACGVAQGLAFGAGLPVVAVGTLEAMAEAVDAPRVLSALDARMDEIYLAAYEREDADWRCVMAPVLCTLADLPQAGGDWVGCGNAFAVHADALRTSLGGRLVAVRAEVFAHAREMAVIAGRVHARGGSVDPADAAPLYVRDKVAMTVAERRARAQT